MVLINGNPECFFQSGTKASFMMGRRRRPQILQGGKIHFAGEPEPDTKMPHIKISIYGSLLD
jgi:hypothetical protein